MRYRFYREHKYLTYLLFDLEQSLAKTDFMVNKQIKEVQEKLHTLASLLKSHASFEDNRLHELLRKKDSFIHIPIEDAHKIHEEQLTNFQKTLENSTFLTRDERLSQGYHLYLSYRLFVSDILRHFHEEETVVMQEQQKLHTDQELREVEFNTYSLMTVEQMIHMTEVLFPHMNANDRESFIRDMKDSEPHKFQEAWPDISKKIAIEEQGTWNT